MKSTQKKDASHKKSVLSKVNDNSDEKVVAANKKKGSNSNKDNPDQKK